MQFLARGYAYKEIAGELHISARTVESHASAVLRKLQLSSGHELTHWAARHRIVCTTPTRPRVERPRQRYRRGVLDPYPQDGHIGEIYLTEAEIQTRVRELGEQIAGDLAGEVPLLITILKGSVLFAADLMRAIPGAVEIDFMAVSSYGDETKSSGIVKIVKDLDESIAGRHVILIEDIVDSGLTMTYLLNLLGSREPASIRACSLLVREGQQAAGVTVDYIGFEIPQAFVVGYGLDYAQQFRNLPYIGVYTGPGSGAEH